MKIYRVTLNYFLKLRNLGNLYTNLGGYFELCFIMTEVGDLDERFGFTLCIFYDNIGG